MLSTLESFQSIAALYENTSTNLDEITIEYQSTRDVVNFAYVFCKLFPYTKTQVDKYFYLTDSDKASFAVEELDKAMLDFKLGQGAKIQTFYSRYLNNRLRSETQLLSHQKRKTNNSCESYEAFMEIRQGYIEQGYKNSEFIEMLRHMNLTDNELKYCHIIMNDHIEVKDSDAAKQMGVTSAAVHYLKKNLAKKLHFIVVL